jgi:hypothetical protein
VALSNNNKSTIFQTTKLEPVQCEPAGMAPQTAKAGLSNINKENKKIVAPLTTTTSFLLPILLGAEESPTLHHNSTFSDSGTVIFPTTTT